MPQTMLEILQTGPSTTQMLSARTGLSRQAVSRKLNSLGDLIVKYDKVRPPLYYAVKEAFESGHTLPLVAVDPHGNTNLWGVLRPLAHGGFYLQPTLITPKVLLGDNGNGFFDDLPFFLDDMRPQGFIGRQIARDLHFQTEAFPPDPRDWNQEHIGRYLVANGDDLPGNLKLGRTALDRIRRPPQKARREEYPELADKIIEGQNPGSSAGGEQAKFATYSMERESHVIVKFSPKNESDLASRWRDILITEFIACETLHEFNIPAAEVELFDCGDRLFLESIRFDRTGEYGRLPLISMQAVDNEFTGVGTGWQKVGSELHQKGLISWQHLVDICVYWGFGKLINNTDMHLGNLSFSLDGGEGFSLSPVYDMCSMGFAPRSSGEIAPLTFTPPEINEAILVDTAALVKSMAKHFWNRLAENEMISEELRHYLQEDNPATLITE